MDNILDIDLIIGRNKYSKVYSFSLVLFVILLIILYVILTYHYQTYYLLKGRIVSDEIELMIPINDIKNIWENDQLIIDNKTYYYKVTRISESLYIDNNYENYCYIYLKVDAIKNIDNFVYDIKIPKENKVLVKYLKDYL